MQKINPKKAMLIVGAVIVVGAALTGIIYYFATTQSVAITIHDGVTADIYPAKSDKGTDYEGKAVRSATGSRTMRLRENRSYIVASRAGGDFAETRKRLDVKEAKAAVEVKPNFSEQKLASLLPAEKEAIDKAIVALSPNLTALYRISQGKLFAQGEWYGTTLVYKGSDELSSDTLKLVARKENGVWTIVGKPQLYQSNALNPAIPLEIAQAANNLK